LGTRKDRPRDHASELGAVVLDVVGLATDSIGFPIFTIGERTYCLIRGIAESKAEARAREAAILARQAEAREAEQRRQRWLRLAAGGTAAVILAAAGAVGALSRLRVG
jgi:hypothetical protein